MLCGWGEEGEMRIRSWYTVHSRQVPCQNLPSLPCSVSLMSTFFLFSHANLGSIRLLKEDAAESPRELPISISRKTEAVSLRGSFKRRRHLRPQVVGRRGSNIVVVRAGPPSNTTLRFAFVFPLSLLVITVLNAIRIADKLDEKFLEELAVNQAIMDDDDEGEDENDADYDDGGGRKSGKLVMEKEASSGRSRNRPKRGMHDELVGRTRVSSNSVAYVSS